MYILKLIHHVIMKRNILYKALALMVCLMYSIGAAAAQAYACYTPSNTTLTFYYDDQRSSRPGTTYDLNSGSNNPGWLSDGTSQSVTRVVFDPSFAGARPTSTYCWFCMEQLQNIIGLNYLDTFAVTDMSGMFMRCSRIKSLDLSSFKTKSVTKMLFMFSECYDLRSLDLSSFNTENVTNMICMFEKCEVLESLDLTNFNTSKVTLMTQMFNGCKRLETIYVGLDWTTEAVTSSSAMFGGCRELMGGQGTVYDSNHVDKDYAHIDGGTSNPGYLSAKILPYAVYTSTNTTLTFYNDNLWSTRTGTTYDADTENHFPKWYTDSTCRSITRVVFNSSFANARPISTCCWFADMEKLQSITGMKNYLNTSAVTDMLAMFENCRRLTSLDLSNFNTANVIHMGSMFCGCSALTSLDLGSFNTAKSYDMDYMFYDCEKLTSLNLSNFNTANVRNISEMFADCSSLTSLDLSSFNTANVTAMRRVFAGCINLTNLDLSSFNTANVTDMRGMFIRCSKLLTNLDLSNFNTAKVKNMNYMFFDCQEINRLDLSSFNTANVTDMERMFEYCCDLVSIYVGDGWSTEAVTNSDNMFEECYNIRGAKGTTYDEGYIDAEYAHVDGGTNDPGYLTAVTEGYACYTPSNTTLAFYCDDQWYYRPGTTYALNEGENTPGWCSEETTYNMDITRVVFDPSFANARPTSTYEWFSSLCNADHFDGLNYLNTSEVTTMKSMFSDCYAVLTADLSNFDTRKVTDMTTMFAFCIAEQLDLSSFSTENVTNMFGMFGYCSSLKTIYVGDGWSTAGVTNSDYMFGSCTSLVGGKGTTYDENHIDAAYAHIDGGPSNPGYFTQSLKRGDVNGDSTVSIADVTALINYLLTDDASGINLNAADCNNSGNISIADVTALINYLLTDNW